MISALTQKSNLLQALSACGARFNDDHIRFADGLVADIHEEVRGWLIDGEFLEKDLDKKALTVNLLRIHINLINK